MSVPSELEPLTRSPRRYVAVLVALAFFGGAAAGGAGLEVARANGWLPHPPPHHPGERIGEHPRPGQDRREPHGGGRIDRMCVTLGVDEETAKKVHDVFDAHRKDISEIMATMRPKMEAIRKQTNAEVRAVLPAEKQAAFDKWIADQEAQEQQHGPRGPRGERGDHEGGPHGGPPHDAPAQNAQQPPREAPPAPAADVPK